MTEYETELVHEAPVTAVRITPRDTDGNPRHQWGFTFRFPNPEPIVLATARQCPAHNCGEITRQRLIPRSATVIGAFITERYPIDPDNVQALTYALWQRWRDGVAVEAWAEIDTDTWMHLLIPAWYPQVDTRRWTVKQPDHREAYAVGKIHNADAYSWPDPSPLPGTTTFTPRTNYMLSITPLPPPAPGYSNVLTANTVKGTPA